MTVCFRRIGVARQRIRVRHAGEGRGTIILYGGRLRDGGGDGDPLGVGAPTGVAVRATTVTGVAITADPAAVVVDDLLQVGDRPDAIWRLWIWLWCSIPGQDGGITVAGSWCCHCRSSGSGAGASRRIVTATGGTGTGSATGTTLVGGALTLNIPTVNVAGSYAAMRWLTSRVWAEHVSGASHTYAVLATSALVDDNPYHDVA
jgi:hypothetical protein